MDLLDSARINSRIPLDLVISSFSTPTLQNFDAALDLPAQLKYPQLSTPAADDLSLSKSDATSPLPLHRIEPLLQRLHLHSRTQLYFASFCPGPPHSNDPLFHKRTLHDLIKSYDKSGPASHQRIHHCFVLSSLLVNCRIHQRLLDLSHVSQIRFNPLPVLYVIILPHVAHQISLSLSIHALPSLVRPYMVCPPSFHPAHSYFWVRSVLSCI